MASLIPLFGGTNNVSLIEGEDEVELLVTVAMVIRTVCISVLEPMVAVLVSLMTVMVRGRYLTTRTTV